MNKKINDLKQKTRGFHTNPDGTWGTDKGDGDILKGLGEGIAAIIKAFISLKK